MTSAPRARLAVDIGGTFTDIALEIAGRRHARKVLTTARAPEDGVLEGILALLPEAGVAPAEIALIIHGTTLATNAIIERKGAATAMLVTEGFRDSVAMAYENRFDQYDINIDKPRPLVPRHLRWTVPERISAEGKVWVPLDEAAVMALIPELRAHAIESIAIGFLHSYANPAHEGRVAEILAAAMPDLWITRSSEVCPEIREYERLSTAAANAYVQPMIARYLTGLDCRLGEAGFDCPLLMMLSAGGVTTLETAIAFPIRLVDSGPAGGAILASHVAGECAARQVLSFDMGGTTAKICLIDDGRAQTARSFEVARAYRFTKGSGLPLRIPVIEMVEICAGGGSIATVDGMGRIAVGPASAGSEPGPACYDRGGVDPTVTDADLVMGRIDPAAFAGGAVTLAPAKAEAALGEGIGAALDLTPALAGFAVSEMVGENMANAARVHAIERGKDTESRTLVAFGGAAPLHAARLAEKLGIATVIIPTGAGVGSAIGFLRAPVSYEVVRSRIMRLADFDATAVNGLIEDMREEAYAVVESAAPDSELIENRAADMRYIGQGHEIAVALPPRALSAGDSDVIRHAFEDSYRTHYGRTIPAVDVEILNWTLSVATVAQRPDPVEMPPARPAPSPVQRRLLLDPATGSPADVPVHRRSDLVPGMTIPGPALIIETQTTTVVSAAFTACINALGYIVMERH